MGRSRELRELAQQVADALPPFVEDVVPTGSTSRGVAEEHSDVELLVVTETLPSLEEPLAVKPDRLAERIDAALAALDLRAMRELGRDVLALAPDTPTVIHARRHTEELLA